MNAPELKPKRQGHDMSPFSRINAEMNWDIKMVRGAAQNLAHLCRKYEFKFDKVLLKQVPGSDVCMSLMGEIEKKIASKRNTLKQKHEELKQSSPIDKASKP